MIKLFYWAFVALDLAVVVLFFALGLAAAGSSRSNPVSVVLLMLVLPVTVIALSAWVFVRAPSTMWRAIAFALVVAPLAIVAVTQLVNRAVLRANSNASGELTFFTAGNERELIEAIRRDDTLAVAKLVRQAKVDKSGLAGMTPLVSALRELRTGTTNPAVVRLLLAAGADPNKGAGYEIPLEMALQVSQRVGVEPVQLLLDAGADPNRPNESGTPLFFGGTGRGVSPEVLPLLIRHGVSLNAVATNGETALIRAAMVRNWRAAHLLLTSGADWTIGRSYNKERFTEMVAAFGRELANHSGAIREGDAEGYDQVVAFLEGK